MIKKCIRCGKQFCGNGNKRFCTACSVEHHKEKAREYRARKKLKEATK